MAAALFVFLVLLIAFLVLLVITVFFHMHYMVPFVPTPKPLMQTMIDLAKIKPGETVIDLGAGDGRFLIEAGKREPSAVLIGYEGAPGVWIVGKIRLLLKGMGSVAWYRKNFFGEDLSSANVIFTYLSMETMKRLLDKFRSELRPGTRIVTHAFRLPDIEPTEKREVKGIMGGKTNAYLYVWK